MELKPIVIKCGTRVLVDDQQRLRPERIALHVASLKSLSTQGYQPIFVTSGAVALGLRAFGKDRSTANANHKRAAAAMGQVELLHCIKSAANEHDLTVAQLLLSRDDFEDRERFLSLRDTFEELLSRKIIPIVNENDVTAQHHTGFRDNDHVAALSSIVVDAERLIFLSSTDGIYQYESGEKVERIKVLPEINKETFRLVEQEADALSLGGMRSKLLASRLAHQAGARVSIISGDHDQGILEAVNGEDIGTQILPPDKPVSAQLSKRKAWIALINEQPGSVTIDDGAVEALTNKSKSLLAVGIIRTSGEFHAGSVINILCQRGTIIGKGIIQISSSELERVLGMKTEEAKKALRKKNLDEVINRDDLVVFP